MSISPEPPLCISGVIQLLCTVALLKTRYRNYRSPMNRIPVCMVTAAACLLGFTRPAAPHPVSAADTLRRVAITIDDLPTVSSDTTQANKTDITRKILAHLRQAKAPATAFVIGAKLLADSTTPDPRSLNLLRAWLQAGVTSE